ncbi:MAG: RNA-binding S4 domain-containing protein [Lachnospiraceae bacterium]|nr:RNA-binding S4 domain-containing protein [Lachnospiraceae bacterium]MCR4595193.1 RNA-binding S4 domain-containing protein [Lachnospiraceae bacterium]
MTDITIKDEYIKLGQALKKSGISSNGADAKMDIQEGLITVNGEIELRRGRKLYDGDVFAYDGDEFRVIAMKGQL